eukprot:gene8347-2852_t
MEIATYVISGVLTHKDSEGHQEQLARGSVQLMSAGAGLEHSEQNKHKKNPLRFIQTWITPRVRDGKPRYTSRTFHEMDRKNHWCHLVGDELGPNMLDDDNNAIEINQDANLYVTELDPVFSAVEIEFELEEDRQAYIVILEGQVDVSHVNNRK